MDIPVYIALYQKNIDVLENKLKDISNPLSVNYGKWLKTDELNKIIYPVDTDVIQVTDWLESNNITNIHNYGDSIKFTTTKNIICSIFGLEHNTVKLTGYKIPLHLRHIIKFVEMSSNHIKRITKINITTNNSTDDRYFAREPLLDLYNVREINLNKNVSGGLIEYQSNDGFTNDDLNFQQIVNKQDINNLTKVVGNNLGYDAESELDVQLISQAADGIDLWYWQSPYWLFSFAVDFYNKDDVPDIISMSWGWSESSQCDIIDCNNITSQQYVERVNNEYLKIALRGITMTVSSGDAGAPGRTNEGCDATRPINPVFPGSSPYVVSIGATYVPIDDSITKYYTTPICNRNACITSHDEKSIRFDRVGWTAGGGFDIYHKETPWWQLNAVKQYLNSGVKLPNPNNFNRNGRAYPDVSAIGHSCPTFINGELQKIDGTSCSSPVVAGLLSIINDFMWTKYNIKLGYANPLLYYIHEHCDNCFKDITDGYNWCTEDMCCVNTTDYGFNATNGYDPVSGLGTLNIGNILDFLDNLFN
jgi:tripeptidyl-peptidase-1